MEQSAAIYSPNRPSRYPIGVSCNKKFQLPSLVRHFELNHKVILAIQARYRPPQHTNSKISTVDFSSGQIQAEAISTNSKHREQTSQSFDPHTREVLSRIPDEPARLHSSSRFVPNDRSHREMFPQEKFGSCAGVIDTLG